ncbi:MAG: DUF2232 domain-containing protein [Holosporaceae bacterium]|jgi:uncharacterized protein YybS (DUF2232 family)|nr:DUF2232 domain-containing protein [Holosporaceae bacterium]
MLPNNRTEFFLFLATFLAIYGVFALFSVIFPISGAWLTYFFFGLPVFVAFLAFGDHRGAVVSAVAAVSSFLILPAPSATEVLFSSLAPAVLLGHLSLKSITVKRKTWWYPESLLLRRFMLLSFASVIFLSLFVYREELLMKGVNEMLKIISEGKDPKIISSAQSFGATAVKYAVGMQILMKMLISLLNFHLAHLIAKRMKKNIRPGFDFRHLTIDGFMAVTPLVALTAALLFPSVSFVCSGIFVAGLFAPMICGFSVIKGFSGGQKWERTWNVFFGCALLFLTFPTIVCVVLLGIVDSFHPIRKNAIDGDITEV